MKDKICISTGLVYRLTNDRNEMIRRLREFSPDGIEISFAEPQFLFDFIPSQDNIEYLRRIRTSIHAPWNHITYGTVTYGKNETSKQVLDAIQKLYGLVDAKNVTFHKTSDDDLSVLEGYQFTSSVENDDWKFIGKGRPTSIEDIGRILQQHPSLKFTFDFAHAYTINPESIPGFLERLSPRMSQVHIAYLSRGLKDHYFLHKNDSPRLRELIKMIPQDIPLVLECVAENVEDVESVRKEIAYLREI